MFCMSDVYVCVFANVEGFVKDFQIDCYTGPITQLLPLSLVWNIFNEAVNMHSKKKKVVSIFPFDRVKNLFSPP